MVGLTIYTRQDGTVYTKSQNQKVRNKISKFSLCTLSQMASQALGTGVFY